MLKTISFHCGSTYSRGHNIRDERYTAEQKHIDKELSKYNVVVFDCPVREKYNEIFQSAVEDYNAHQSRADRKIDDYYLKIKSDKRKNPVYEVIVQIGDKDDTGNLAEKEKNALRDYAENWDKRNPNLKLVGAYIHADEPNGTVHAHIDFIPVAKSSRGMKLQNSFAKALEQQGHKGIKATQTAQMSWQQAEREYLEKICAKHKIQAKANQDRTPRPHMTSNEYRHEKEKMEEEIKPLRDAEMAQIDELRHKAEILHAEVETLSERRRELTESELKSIDVTPKRISGGFKGLSAEQAQQLVNTASILKKENKGLKKQVSLLTDERDKALERAEQAEEQNKARMSIHQLKEQQQKSEREKRERERAEQLRQLQSVNEELSEKTKLVKKYLTEKENWQLETDFQFSKGAEPIYFDAESDADEFEQNLVGADYRFKKNIYSDGTIEFSVPKRYYTDLYRLAEDIKTPDFTQHQSRGMSL